mgnify:CR=1 FL=1
MGGLKNSLKIFHKHANLKYKNVEIDIDLHPFSWIDIIKLLLGNEFGILPDSFLLIIVFRLVRDVVANHKTTHYAGAATKVIQKNNLDSV